ncbi:SusC/RagA family TonB-linked outer membrane protein [Bacteroides acidifaciens]|uniref:TonB-dependent receptor n=5 Tax=Bacteroides TaxID=816 RepID=A0A7K3MNX4_9BACE|nr:TonB-dependent receptor [Bacteroides acidifaciens]MBF0728298.1 TonB-dependent receptor [Bacteroides acidifaciens]MBF0835172.1 TonB-dependent receptor [Bacteroides acidifaciens]NDO55879.1 TonB-dependent receptor [Bacteroides acidifaciens]TFU52770.1 TonB-dependent receptor [Bacteroides acidifaciens]GFH85473.1 TonB-dependent receptor SusC [Bacteroides acidifaciens]
MEIKSKFLCSKGVALAFAMLLGGSPGVLLYANDSVEESLMVAQTGRAIKGLVTDANGEPLIGCNVVVVGSNAGVITDIDGRFALNVPADAKQIKVSYIGYVDQVVNLNDRSDFKVVLKEDNNALDEVVVVGYGTQKKATLTGAVEQVSSKVLESRAITNVGAALQGATPGLVVTRSSSRPGNEGLNFQIRGATSVNGGSPLIIIDGVPALNASAFQNLNSDDVESISVLKDGSASIYGAKAANGVILVTTKKGKGKTTVDYNFNMRFTTNGIMAFSPSMQEYATMWIEANKEQKVKNWWNWSSEENMLMMQQGIEGIYHTNAKDWGYDIFIGNANRLEEMFARRYSYQHNLSLSGATEKTDYRISLAYADNQANLATAYDGQKQLNLRLNYGIRLTDWFKLETSANMIKTNTEMPSAGLDKTMYGNEPPFFPAKNPYGQWYANFGGVGDRQPVAATTDGGRDERMSLISRVDVKALVDIWKGISFEGMASFQNEEYRRDRYVNEVQTYDWYGNPATKLVNNTQQSLIYLTDVLNLKDIHNPAYLMQANNRQYQYYSALLKYKHTFAQVHNVEAMLGINAEKWMSKNMTTAREKMEDAGVYDLNLAYGAQGNAGGKSQNGSYSYIMRLNYNYAEKYLVEFIGRRDGNSKFAKGHKFKNFVSASAGWVFTEEQFLKPITPVVNFGKLRFSYGNSGNDAGLGDFDYVTLVTQGTTAFGGTNPKLQVNSGLGNNGLVSLDRTWERVEQKNLGIDLHFLNSRLTTSFDYFIKDNIGMLSNVIFPGVLGGNAPKTNSGHLNVKGWEFTIGWRDQIKDFSYYANFNIGDTKSMLKELQGADTYGAGVNRTVNGYPLNSFFLYRTDGFFKDQAEVDRYYALYGGGQSTSMGSVGKGTDNELRPGDTKRLDMNGDYKITDVGSKDSDLQFMGDANPHFVYGMTVGGSWKGIDFSAMFQGVAKQYIMRNDWMAYPFRTLFTNQNPTFLGQTWTEDNPNAKYPRMTNSTQRAEWNYQNNDFMLQNSRYIRLKTLIVGYTLPQIWTRKVKLEKVRVYFSGNDLWEATSIRDGFDPEMGSASNTSGYPFARTWSFGLNVTL